MPKIISYDATEDLDALIALRKQTTACVERLMTWKATDAAQAAAKKKLNINWPEPPAAGEVEAHDMYVAAGGLMSYNDVAAKMQEKYPAEGYDVWNYRSIQRGVWKAARWRAMSWAESLVAANLT